MTSVLRRFIVMAASVMCAFSAANAAQAAGLSPAEKKLVTAAEAENARSIELLEKLVNINSGTMNLEGVEQVGKVLLPEFEQLGFKVKWVPMSAVGRAGHIVAEHKGTGRGKRMLLIGHMDTVFEKDSPFQNYVRRGDIAEGPGVNDMKDGLVIMIASLRAMKAAGTLTRANIIIVLSGDEERAGRPFTISRKDMIDAASRSDVALEFESLAFDNGADVGSISRRSSSNWALTVKAKSGHSSGLFSDDAGFGATYELARILDTFRRELREPNATYNAGIVMGGATAEMNSTDTGGSVTGKTNIIPATAIARGDLRTLSNEQTMSMRQKMRDIVAHPLGGTSAEITFEEGYPAMPPTEGNRALLGVMNGVNRDLGLKPMGELHPLKRGAGDISFVADKVDGLIGFGGVGQGSHAPGETLDLTSLDRQIKRTAIFMTRLAR